MAATDTRQPRKKYRKHSPKRRPLWTSIFKWLKRNPLKTLAILFIYIFIYLIYLFYQYDKHLKDKAGGNPQETTE